jgi:hypothetical protein
MRRVVGLFALALVGCGGSKPTPAETPAPPPPQAESTPLPPPINHGLAVRGGKGEAPPPAPKPIPPGTMTLPEGGGAWPWTLAAAAPVTPAEPVSLKLAAGATTGVAVARDALKAVVAVGEGGATRVLWCDLDSGKVAVEWEVPDAYELLGISPDGARFLLLRREPGARDMLHLWTAKGQDLTRTSWTPHDSSASDIAGGLATGTSEAAKRERQVRWAAFSGKDRIVTTSVGGQLRVWNAANRERTGTLEGTLGTPGLSPDGTRVAFLTAEGVALLDPAAAKVVGVRKAALPPGELTIAPTGTMLAAAANGRVVVLDLETGERSEPKGGVQWEREVWVVTPAGKDKATLAPAGLKPNPPPGK